MLAALTAGAAQTTSPPPVSIVIVLQAPDMSPATIARLTTGMAKARTISTRIGNPGKARLYAPSFAGTDVGSLVIVVEYPSLQALAESDQKMATNPEWQAVIGEIMGAGFKVVSQSLVTEVPY